LVIKIEDLCLLNDTDKITNIAITFNWMAEGLCKGQLVSILSPLFETLNIARLFKVLHPEGCFEPIFKGVHSRDELLEALDKCFDAGFDVVKISTDLRACHSPVRQKTIVAAGKNLLERLKSLCPVCLMSGFCIDRVIKGLVCADCRIPTQIAKKIVLRFSACKTESERDRPDGKRFAEAAECQFCNP
jgi:hypothetical protein